MRRFLAVPCAAALFAAALSASAAAAPSSLTVVGVQTSQEGIPPAAVHIAENLLRGRTVVGHDRIRCLVRQHKIACTGTFFLHGGTLRARTVPTAGSPSRGTITGGTGAYAGARGALTLHDLSEVRTRITFRFS